MGYNYGSKRYLRVKETYKLILKITICISMIFWLIFHIFPAQIMSIFGGNDKLYLEFAVQYVHIFLFFVFINGAQITASTFFQAIGMAKKGTILALTKQVTYLLPLMLILPMYFGLFGIVYATPVADLLAFLTAITAIYLELKKMPNKNYDNNEKQTED